ncbi:hypothetical protein ACMD2_10096 [Ananas comosus]|uniref:DUF632 domain-containing protein n=1 Tax=Ananas comosus TaxID=4615 RepID=A0A199V677_ANACO|nr:hypothetical protein ACMD2_10096 [Ananas comosus]
MGLQQSKNVDAVEAVALCQERKQFMGAAVAARNAFAAAHSAYSVALKNTGAALSNYAHHDHDHDHDHDHTTTTTSSSPAAIPPVSVPPPPLLHRPLHCRHHCRRSRRWRCRRILSSPLPRRSPTCPRHCSAPPPCQEGELMKIEYHRKAALLNQQRKRGVRPEVLERSKFAVVYMQTRCSVDRESMNSTVAEIIRLRDHQLYPKLVDLVEGMVKMWEVMFEHHRSQLRAITECRAFDFALAPRETSEQHRQRTAQLRDSAREWHSSFEGLFTHQKDYIRSLNSWLSLNLVPIENGRKEKDSSLSRETDPPIKILLQAWHQYLDVLPHDLAKNAMHGFAEVMSALLALQDDELKLKSECEDARKDLERKRWQFEDWHRKHAERRGALPALEGAESANQATAAVERRIMVEAAEMKLKEAEENHKKHCKQVRERSIGSLRTHLPELFRAMSDFAFASCQMYKRLWSITQFKGQGGG